MLKADRSVLHGIPFSTVLSNADIYFSFLFFSFFFYFTSAGEGRLRRVRTDSRPRNLEGAVVDTLHFQVCVDKTAGHRDSYDYPSRPVLRETPPPPSKIPARGRQCLGAHAVRLHHQHHQLASSPKSSPEPPPAIRASSGGFRASSPERQHGPLGALHVI